MVSLSNDRNHSGGYFGFSNDCVNINTSSSDDELISDHIELASGPEISHRPMKTSWAIILAKLVYIALLIATYIIPYFCDTGQCGDDPISLTMYIHGGVWFLLFILDRFLQHKHDKSRLNGYLDFYRKTRNIRRLPVFINSCANAFLVIVTKVLDNHCDAKGNCKFFSKAHYIQIIISIECFVALIVLVVYLVQTVKFNSSKALPDVTQSDLTLSFESAYLASDVGYRNENDYYYQVMEKQADMIRFLQQHSELLARRNLKLTNEAASLRKTRPDEDSQ